MVTNYIDESEFEMVKSVDLKVDEVKSMKVATTGPVPLAVIKYFLVTVLYESYLLIASIGTYLYPMF